MISSISTLTANQTGNETAGSGAEKADPLTNKDTFLRLLVAQLQNQNPLDPSDPIEFMTQLTQFSNLEQSLGSRQELASIRATLEELAQRSRETTAPTAKP